MKNRIALKSTAFDYSSLISVFVLVLMVIVFALTAGETFLSPYNIKTVCESVIPYVFGGLGMIFVIAQGGIDMSQGAIVGVAGMLCCYTAKNFGTWTFFPVALVTGGVIGLINGLIIAKYKVPSFMTTLAMMITLRALCSLFSASGLVANIPLALMDINSLQVKLPILGATILVVGYIFEHSRVGYYVKVMGESERVVRNAGVATDKYKILAFLISGMMAGLSSAMTIARVGGSSALLGQSFELNVMMALFMGGVLITGGTTTHVHKLLIGAFIIAILENGLTQCGITGALYQAMKGVLLISIVILIQFVRVRSIRSANRRAVKAVESLMTEEK